jgi:hypothetical protein
MPAAAGHCYGWDPGRGTLAGHPPVRCRLMDCEPELAHDDHGDGACSDCDRLARSSGCHADRRDGAAVVQDIFRTYMVLPSGDRAMIDGPS